MDSIRLKSIPSALQWAQLPVEWQLASNDAVTITAGPSTDLFNDPQGAAPINNSPRLMFEPEGNFILSAKVKVNFHSTFDAGVLMVYANSNLWAKLCFEFSPQREPMLVSVVTHALSDDCNSRVIDGNEVYLRIARLNQTFAFHYSTDSQYWHMLRLFSLGELQDFAVGFSSQSPTGDSCTASFSEIKFAPKLLGDVRSGE